MRRLLLIFLVWLPILTAAEDWTPIQFLIGQWSGQGAGEPGKSTGAFSFAPDLQGRVLVRKSFAEYRAADGKPASRHDDLLIVYRDEISRQFRAMYFDSEGHVIPYTVQTITDRVVFTSEGGREAARYRLTYTNVGADRLKMKFEVAPPGRDLATYLDAEVHRN